MGIAPVRVHLIVSSGVLGIWFPYLLLAGVDELEFPMLGSRPIILENCLSDSAAEGG